MQIIYLALAVSTAYLVGSVPFAVLTSRVMGLADPRTYGSRNPGATNVLRSGSKVAAALTLFGDAFKGWLAVWLALRWGLQFGLGNSGIALVAIAVFLGHLYPLFLRFRGGKGVATAAGVIVAFSPWIALACALTWVAVAAVFRYSSAASIAAAVVAPFLWAFAFGFDAQLIALVIIAGFIVYRHRVNIQSLVAGTERRIARRNKQSAGD